MTGIFENDALQLTAYAYDNLGRRLATYRQNGADTYYGYDAASRLASLALNPAGTGNDQAWTFTYNAAGQVRVRTAANAVYEWAASQTSKSYGVNDPMNRTDPSGLAWLRNFTCTSSTRSGGEIVATCSNNWTYLSEDGQSRTPSQICGWSCTLDQANNRIARDQFDDEYGGYFLCAATCAIGAVSLRPPRPEARGWTRFVEAGRSARCVLCPSSVIGFQQRSSVTRCGSISASP